MMWSQRKLVFLAAAGAFALGLALPMSRAALADPAAPALEAAPITAPDAAAPVIGSGSGAQVPPGIDGAAGLIDAAAFEEIADITERITPYLYVGDDGLVQMRPVTAEELGVSEQFLSDYRAAMTYSNQAISAGDIVVNDDLTVTTRDGVFKGSLPSPGFSDVPSTSALGDAGGTLDAAPGEAVPEWGAWRYPDGAIFYNSHSDWTYYRNAYYALCNSMAAYLGHPWMGQPLMYFYGYNQMYVGRYCYSPAGVYWYMPYSYCGYGLGYKPAYFWGRTLAYSYGCGCYQYQWAWQGLWCRY